MQLKKVNAFIALASMAFLAGCGTSTSHLTSPTTVAGVHRTKFGESQQPTFGSGDISSSGLKMATSGIALSNISTVSTAVAFTGNLNGWCDFGNKVRDPILGPGPKWTVLNGFGVSPVISCGNSAYPGSATSAASGLLSDSSGTYLLGSGTLSNLVVVASPGYKGTATLSGTVEVFVNRGGVVTATPITCSLGEVSSPSSYTRCQDTTDSFSNQDGDQLFLLFNDSDQDVLPTIQWFLEKQ